jgi:uncharacterized protein YjbI with pentapeptide repeats
MLAEFKEACQFYGAEFLSEAQFSEVEFRDGADFGTCDISDCVFDNATLTASSFEDAEATAADFREANLESSDFSSADLRGANLERTKLSNSDLFDTNLSGTRLYGTRMGDVAINSQTVFDDHGTYRCVYDPHSEYEYTPDDENVGRLTKSMGAYHVLEQLTRANTLPDEQSKFFARRQDMRRAQLRSEGRRVSYWFAEAQNAIFRHGESFSRVIGWSIGTIIAFAFIFPLGGWLQSDSTGTLTYGSIADSPEVLWQSFHHSSLLFLTGGGPLNPTGFVGELLITIEAMIAPILLALLIFVLGRRAAR